MDTKSRYLESKLDLAVAKITYRQIKSGNVTLSPEVPCFRVRKGTKVIDSFLKKANMVKIYPGIRKAY